MGQPRPQDDPIVAEQAAEEPNVPVVCYFGTYRASYSRNRIMIEGLRRSGVRVIECHQPLWHGVEDRIATVHRGWLKPAFWKRVITTYWQLLRRYRALQGQYDVMVVGYPGQFDIFLARLLTWRWGKPLVWDVFMSIYLIAKERQLDQQNRFTVNMLRLVEWFALRVPDMLVQDTAEYVQWFHRTYGLAPARFRLVPTGADSRRYFPDPTVPVGQVTPGNGPFTVIYYGTFIANHGLDYLMQAAGLLQSYHDIRFVLVGDGPDKQRIQQQVHDAGMTNVIFQGWMEPDQLQTRIAAADVVLGAFGGTPQSLMTVQNKVYEGLAMGKAVITGDSPAMRATFIHGDHIYLCDRGRPAALASAVLHLYFDPVLRQSMAENGYRAFRHDFDLDAIGRRFAGYLDQV